jgi:hypothetical protein
VYGFLLPQLDLRAGRQRIVWGPAERVSVIDNVNPLDLSDPWDFGRRLSSDSVRLRAYLWVLTLEAVYVAYFRPALLPADGSAAVSLPAGLPAARSRPPVAAPRSGWGERDGGRAPERGWAAGTWRRTCTAGRACRRPRR